MSRRVVVNGGDREPLLPNRTSTGKYSLPSSATTTALWTAIVLLSVGLIVIIVFGALAYAAVTPGGTINNHHITTAILHSISGWIGNLTATTFQSDSGTITNLTATNFIASTFQSLNSTITNLIVTTFSSASGTVTNLTTTNLALDMQSFSAYNHAVNGTVVSSHNLQTISGASIVSVGLPASLASLVGKEIKICNADGKRHIVDVTPAGTFWDTRNFWRVIQFDTNSRGCCVTFSVLASTPTPIISLVSKGERCSTFCTATNLWHCIDPERPETTNPFHGLWEKETNGNSFRTIPYIRIDMTTVPAIGTLYRGNVKSPRERIALDAGLTTNLFTVASNVIGQSSTPNYARGNAGWFMMQPGNTRFSVSRGFTDSDLAHEFAGSYIKAVEDNIVPSTTVIHNGLDPNHPEAILRNWYENLIYQDLPFLSKSAAPFAQFIGHAAASGHLDTLIDTGVSYTTPISTIFVSQTTEKFTVLRTDDYHHVSPTGTVTISGCTGSWVALNGVHVVTSILGTNAPIRNPLYVDYGPVPANRTQHHEVAILFDTLDAMVFTRDANGVATSTGPCVMAATYGPITGATEYRPTIAAVWNLFYEAFRNLFHTRPLIYHSSAPGTIIPGGFYPVRRSRETWDQVVADVAGGSSILARIGSRRINSVASTYHNGALRYALLESLGPATALAITVNHFPYNINNRFGVRYDVDKANITGQYYHDITRKNYLEQVKVPYWRCKPSGNVKTGSPNTLYGVTFATTDGGCDYFEPTLRDFDATPPTGYSPFSLFNLNSGSLPPITQDIFKSDFYVGMINTTFTGGPRIGYIRIASTAQQDLLFGFNDRAFFPPVSDASSDTREAFAYLIKDVMSYLVTNLTVESIIIDNRGSTGGNAFPNQVLRSFFGAGNVRPITWNMRPFSAGLGFVTNPLNLISLQYPFDMNVAALKSETIFVATSATNYPSSMFTGVDKRVYIITSQDAVSAGDLLINNWLGQNLDRNLGGGVTSKIVGDMIGLFEGGNTNAFVQVGSNNARIRTAGGAIVSPLAYGVDTTFAGQRPDGSWISNLHPSMQIDCTTLPGKSGGCPMPNDDETLLFPDLGFLPNTRPQLPGDARVAQPIPTIKSTWRDAWLEATVRTELMSKRRRRSVDADAPKANPPLRRTVYDPQESYNMYGVDITCPQGVTLTPLSEMQPTVNITVPAFIGDDLDARLEREQAVAQATSIITDEYRNGGLCRTEDGRIMATPSCQAFPALVIA